MPLNDYRIEGWTPGSRSEQTIGVKNGVAYRLKRFNDPSYPARDDPASPRTQKKIRQCEAMLASRQRINAAIARATQGDNKCFAYAEEVFLNTSIDAPGVIEAVRVVEDTRDLDFIRMNPHRLFSAMLSCADALKRLHGANIVHADIKPENILFTVGGYLGSDIHAILIDFDRSYFSDQPPGPDDIGGTTGYLAPEVIAYMNDEECSEDGSDSKYRPMLSKARDIYALGATFHRLLTRVLPEMTANGLYIRTADIKAACDSDNLCALIRRMLSPSPDKRPDAAEVYLELLNEYTQFMENPTSKPSARSGYGRHIRRSARAAEDAFDEYDRDEDDEYDEDDEDDEYDEDDEDDEDDEYDEYDEDETPVARRRQRGRRVSIEGIITSDITSISETEGVAKAAGWFHSFFRGVPYPIVQEGETFVVQGEGAEPQRVVVYGADLEDIIFRGCKLRVTGIMDRSIGAVIARSIEVDDDIYAIGSFIPAFFVRLGTLLAAALLALAIYFVVSVAVAVVKGTIAFIDAVIMFFAGIISFIKTHLESIYTAIVFILVVAGLIFFH